MANCYKLTCINISSMFIEISNSKQHSQLWEKYQMFKKKVIDISMIILTFFMVIGLSI